MKDIAELIELAKIAKDTRTYSTNVTLFEDKEYRPYEACVSYKEISFYCEDVVLCYDVNSMNSVEYYIELVDILED